MTIPFTPPSRPQGPSAPIGNRYLGPSVSGALSTESLPANTLRAVPIELKKASIIGYLATYFLDGGGSLRMALYDDVAGVPTNRLQVDGGGQGISAGLIVRTMSTFPLLPAGRYWVAALTDTARTVQAIDAQSPDIPADTAGGLITGCWSAAQAYGQPPAVFPSPTPAAGVKTYRLFSRFEF